jgi:phosphoesterase RecJ-like protein
LSLFDPEGPPMLDWSPFVDVVRRCQRFVLTTHVRPDPDAIGSSLALAEVLEGMGKQVRAVISSVWPPRYDFMDPTRRIAGFKKPGDEYRDADAVIVIDTGTWSQLGDFGDFMKTLACPKVVIDHHVSQDDLGATRLVDMSAEAAGRLVYQAIQALGQPITPKVASLLFAALATDTGWFRHKNTAPASFGLAEILVASGAEPTRLYEHLYEQNTLPRLKLQGLALSRMQVVHGGKTAFCEIHRADYAATGSIPSDTEELVNAPRSIIGVQVALVFMEQPVGGIKVSFRSRDPIDVSKIAETFNGGGHRLASGAILEASMEEAKTRVLDAVGKALEAA